MKSKNIWRGVLGLTVMVLLGGTASGAPEPKGFGKTFGGVMMERPYSIQETRDGYLVVAAYRSESGSQAGRRFFRVLKLDQSGDLSSSQNLESINYYHYAALIPVENDEYVIAGKLAYFTTFRKKDELFVMRVDDKRQKSFESEHAVLNTDSPFDLKRTRDKGYVVAGKTSYVGQGMADYCVIRLDKQGKKVWDKSYGTTYEDAAVSVEEVSDGGFIVAGNTSRGEAMALKLDKQGKREWWTNLAQEALLVTEADNGYALLGIVPASSGQGAGEAAVTRLTGKGKEDWQRRLAQFKLDGEPPVMIKIGDGFVIAGETDVQGDGNLDLFVLKLDLKGNRVWDKTFGGPQADGASVISRTRDGGFIVAGYTESFANPERDLYDRVLWVIKLDSNGDCPVQACHQK